MRLTTIGIFVMLGVASVVQAQTTRSSPVRFRPRLSPGTAPAPSWYPTHAKSNASAGSIQVVGHDTVGVTPQTNNTEVICGMIVIRPSTETDPKMIVTPKREGAAIRTIKPSVCTPQKR